VYWIRHALGWGSLEIYGSTSAAAEISVREDGVIGLAAELHEVAAVGIVSPQRRESRSSVATKTAARIAIEW
jgi:hypothetical protein